MQLSKNAYGLAAGLFFFIATVKAQTISIADARTKTQGTKVTVKGIVLNGSELGVIRYLYDNTGGIAAYGSSLSTVNIGDSISVTGTLKDYNSLLELDPVENFTVLNSGNTLPQAKAFFINTLYAENYEAQLVKVTGVRFVAGGTFAANTNYKIRQGAIEKEVRINTGSNLVGTPIPTGSVNLTGIMSQFKTTYQLLLRTTDDIEQAGPVLLTPLMQSNITKTGFDLSFTTKFNGNTIIKYGKTAALELGTKTDNASITEHKIGFTNLDAATFYYAQAFSVDANNDTSGGPLQLFSTASNSSGKMQVYFNRSVENSVSFEGNKALHLNQAIDDSLVSFINGAKESLDIAIYSFDNANLSANITNAINAAYDKGIKVRIIIDGSLQNGGQNTLNVNIPKLKSPSQSATIKIMHNKFIVRDAFSADADNAYVWTGSTNFTDNQIHGDPNHVVTIQDQSVAKAYVMEFEEMWGSNTQTPNNSNSKFGPNKTDNTPHLFNVNGSLLEVYFSPSDRTTNKIINALKSADKELYLGVMVFTRTDIAYAIRDEINDGVFAAGVLNDTSDASSKTVYQILKPHFGNNLRIYTGSGIFHHKYAVVDPQITNSDPLVISGSHNWSSSAENNNDENTIIYHDSLIANLFYQEWIKRYFESGGTDTFKYVYVPTVSLEERKTSRNNYLKIEGYAWQNNGLRVKVNTTNTHKAQFLLTDIQGRKITLQPHNLQNGENHIYMPAKMLNNGIYVLTVYDVTTGQKTSCKLAKF